MELGGGEKCMKIGKHRHHLRGGGRVSIPRNFN